LPGLSFPLLEDSV